VAESIEVGTETNTALTAIEKDDEKKKMRFVCLFVA